MVDLQARASSRFWLRKLGYQIVIIDDDPTGNQTVYDLPLLGNWSVESLQKAVRSGTPAFFILANTRSLTESEAITRTRAIAQNLRLAAQTSQRKLLIVSRSDSTLRGHFPAEVDALAPFINRKESILFFAPAMFEGKRITLDNTQYIRTEEGLLPVSETPYAQDPSFGYQHAHLPDWLEEKSGGMIRANEVRALNKPGANHESPLQQQLQALSKGDICIMNAVDYRDMDRTTEAIWKWLSTQSDPAVMFRSSSSLLPSLLGLPPKPLIHSASLSLPSSIGGLLVVGSFVPTTTAQLANLQAHYPQINSLELDPALLLTDNPQPYLHSLTYQVNQSLAKAQHLVLYTSRKLVRAGGKEAQLQLGKRISEGLVEIIRNLSSAPSFLMVKGGITSHDLAIKALGMKEAIVKGQLLPGIPVWEMGPASRFPGLTYVVFPGNVGGPEALTAAFQKMTHP